MVGDAGVPTGFERVVRGIADHLFARGDYDITVRGVGYHTAEESFHKYPYTVKPWGGAHGDPLGVRNTPEWLTEDRPELLFFVQDLWNITNYTSYKPREIPSVCYFPVDAPNLKPTYGLGLGAMAAAAAYTKFGAMEAASSVRKVADQIFEAHEHLTTEKLGWSVLPKDEMKLHVHFDRIARYQNPSAWDIIPHGMEKGRFEPRDKAEARRLFQLPLDAKIVSNINTNQFRKRQDLTIRAFKLLLALEPEAFLVLHCAGGDRDGWDLYDLVDYFGVPKDRVACIHYAKKNLTDDELCWLYNTADININTGGGEGWGLTAMESAACGVPQFVPDWSACRELWTGSGVLFPIDNFRAEPRYLNTMHAEIDIVAASELMADVLNNKEWHATLASRAYDKAALQLSWDEVGARFHTLFEKALTEPELIPLSKSDLIDRREPGVESELTNVPVL
jgi:glycosyltransferase involved in cell wall biosynthesis